MFLFSSSRICFLIYVSCSLYFVSSENLQDPTKWMCADENCSNPISVSTVIKQYIPDDSKKIHVKKGTKVEVLRKPADPSLKYYYVKSLVTSEKGLISKAFIRETKTIHQDRDLIEVQLKTKSVENKGPDISPSAPTNVYDGTTLVNHYEDVLYPYVPTQSRGQPNDVGSPSVVQSTTPPSVIGDDSSSSVDSTEVESKNASEGEQESKYASSEPSASSDSSVTPERPPGGQTLGDDGIGISSTPASSINNEPSQSHDIPKDADIVQPTTEIPVSPDPILINKSQTQENLVPFEEAIDVEDVNVTSSSGLPLDTKEGETFLENFATTIKTFSLFGNDDPTEERESQVSLDELQAEVESDSEPVEPGASIKKDAESVKGTDQDTSVDDESVNPKKPVDKVHETSTVSTDEAGVEVKSPDLNVEQSIDSGDLRTPPPDLIGSDLKKDLPDPVPDDQLSSDSSSTTETVDITKTNGDLAQSENPNLVDSGISESLSASSLNVATDQHMEDTQSTEKNSTIVDSERPPVEKLSSSAESDDAPTSQNNHVKYEHLLTQPPSTEVPVLDRDPIDEISADSEEDESNIKFESTKSEVHSDDNDPAKTEVHTENGSQDSVNATIEHSDSDSTIEVNSESQKVVEELSPSSSSFLFSSNLDFVDPRGSNPGISSNSPDVQVPAVTEGPPTVPPNAHMDKTVQEVDEDITTPLSEPSFQTGTELPQIMNADIEKSLKEPTSIIEEGSSEPWYSGVFSAIDSIQEMFSSRASQPDVIPSGDNTPEVTPTFQVDEKSETCTGETCDRQFQDNPYQGVEQDGNYLVEDHVWLSPRGIILMIITAIAVLLFSLGHYYLENLKRDVELVSKYNDLAGKLFIEQKEKEMLADQLTSVNESMTQISFDTTKYDEEVAELKTLVQKYKEEKCTIEEKEKETRKKFMMVDKNYNELRNILSQNKQKGERSALILDIRNLKESIAGNNIEIASLKEQLLEKKEEIKSLNARVMEFVETNKQLEENVEKAISENHETAQKYQDNIARLEKTIEESTFSRVKLEKECAQLKKEKESLAIEKELAESSLQKFQRLKPSNSLNEWLDAKEVRVSLLAAEKKIEELTTIRDVLTREKTLVEERERTLVVDLEQLNEKYEKAEKEKIEALTKLQVLSDYFKEKETQLQEELGTKESLWLQKQSDDRTIYEQMRALREENTSFKNQNETLKREILDQEASFKKLITSAEEKAHENWVALRHQERRLKEAQMEASQLRSRLTALEATGDNSDDKMNKGEVNGDIPPFGSATSPPFMLYPEFVPPPPLLTNTPSRPPPLGRISSPPLGDFTPPPPLVPYEMFLPPSPPPPAPHVLHKPQPLDGSHRIQKDSQSSNHSSESVPDRPRRNKR